MTSWRHCVQIYKAAVLGHVARCYVDCMSECSLLRWSAGKWDIAVSVNCGSFSARWSFTRSLRLAHLVFVEWSDQFCSWSRWCSRVTVFWKIVIDEERRACKKKVNSSCCLCRHQYPFHISRLCTVERCVNVWDTVHFLWVSQAVTQHAFLLVGDGHWNCWCHASELPTVAKKT